MAHMTGGGAAARSASSFASALADASSMLRNHVCCGVGIVDAKLGPAFSELISHEAGSGGCIFVTPWRAKKKRALQGRLLFRGLRTPSEGATCVAFRRNNRYTPPDLEGVEGHAAREGLRRRERDDADHGQPAILQLGQLQLAELRGVLCARRHVVVAAALARRVLVLPEHLVRVGARVRPGT
eukprot:scaffold43811_cov62-Phaeocystis_antarctica.AAC.4